MSSLYILGNYPHKEGISDPLIHSIEAGMLILHFIDKLLHLDTGNKSSMSLTIILSNILCYIQYMYQVLMDHKFNSWTLDKLSI